MRNNFTDIDRLSDGERYDMLADMADLYYNKGLTQSEIASRYGTNRFRVAKLIQEARNEQIVEIRINYSNERNAFLEQELKDKLGLKKAVVVNFQSSSFADNVSTIGSVGASFIQNEIKKDMTVGLCWGKTVFGVVSGLKTAVGSPIKVLQLTGNLGLKNPETDAAELVCRMAERFGGEAYYLNAPLYINNESVRKGLLKEPIIKETLDAAKNLDLVLSGIGSRSSLPMTNPLLRAYYDGEEAKKSESFIGSIFGYVLDENGNIADTELNEKLVAVDSKDILRAKSRMVVAYGRHKAEVLAKAAKQNLYNELVTDSETAVYLLESFV